MKYLKYLNIYLTCNEYLHNLSQKLIIYYYKTFTWERLMFNLHKNKINHYILIINNIKYIYSFINKIFKKLIFKYIIFKMKKPIFDLIKNLKYDDEEEEIE